VGPERGAPSAAALERSTPPGRGWRCSGLIFTFDEDGSRVSRRSVSLGPGGWEAPRRSSRRTAERNAPSQRCGGRSPRHTRSSWVEGLATRHELDVDGEGRPTRMQEDEASASGSPMFYLRKGALILEPGPGPDRHFRLMIRGRGLHRPEPRPLRGGSPDLARVRRGSPLTEEPLARTVVAGTQERSARERLAREALQWNAHA
jgi:hypothetical protein